MLSSGLAAERLSVDRPVSHATTAAPAVLCGPPRCVQTRVDAFSFGYRVKIDDARRAQLEQVAGRASCHGAAALEVAGVRLEMKRPSGSRGVYDAGNRDLRVHLEVRRKDDWTVEVIPYATLLMRTERREVVAQCARVAAGFGDVLETRVRRVDLAADLVDWPFLSTDDDSWRLPSVSTVTRGFAEFGEEDHARYFQTEVFRRAYKVTGYSIAQGSRAVMCRVYDKGEELAAHSTSECGREKLALEHEIWSRSGFVVPKNGEKPERVVRVEFQLRGQALAEFLGFNARDPHELLDNLDAVWKYCTVRWCTLIVNDRTRRSRSSIDPRWKALQALSFGKECAPAKRKRRGAGASAEQALGANRSIVAHAGCLPDVGVRSHDDIEPLIASKTDAERVEFIVDYMTKIGACAMGVGAPEYIEHQRDPSAAMRHLLVRHLSADARASTMAPRGVAS